jgi:hypothetical protein
MPEDTDWTAATWEGSRRRQHQAFLALPFRDKLAVIEDLADLAAFFTERSKARRVPSSAPGATAVSPNQAPQPPSLSA